MYTCQILFVDPFVCGQISGGSNSLFFEGPTSLSIGDKVENTISKGIQKNNKIVNTYKHLLLCLKSVNKINFVV